MIEDRVINGRKAKVVWMKHNFVPCDPDGAALVKVLFEDGEMLFLTPRKEANGQSHSPV